MQPHSHIQVFLIINELDPFLNSILMINYSIYCLSLLGLDNSKFDEIYFSDEVGEQLAIVTSFLSQEPIVKPGPAKV